MTVTILKCKTYLLDIEKICIDEIFYITVPEATKQQYSDNIRWIKEAKNNKLVIIMIEHCIMSSPLVYSLPVCSVQLSNYYFFCNFSATIQPATS